MKSVFYITITVILVCSIIFVMGFKPPDKAERVRAIGSTEGLPEILQKAFVPEDDFEPVPKPEPGDWLAEHPEKGQTFDDFVHTGKNRPDKSRNKIYFQPLGEFREDRSPSLEKLKEYASAYFSMEVKVLTPLILIDDSFTTRKNTYTGKMQILTTDILTLLKKKLPDDAFCILAITMEDLYPDPSWNFVFGQASFQGRAGVYSFSRYDPAFYGEKRDKDYKKILLKRSCRVLVHETGHMFGLEHCIFFRCVMNGSNHLEESDSRPLRLCPVCIRKLHSSIEFDIMDRYNRLLLFYKESGIDQETRWMENRLKKIKQD
ncbi:MAG: archaemetzincin [bacterium]